MNSFLRQSTASQSRAIGPFLASSDFLTPMTALTIANTDIKLCANGAASANKNSGGGTHRVNGVYGVTFDATDSAVVGELFVSVVVATALPVFHTFVVLEEAVYDALFAAAAPGYLQPTVAARTLDVSATGEAGIDWANIGAPTTAQVLSGTTIGTATAVTTVNGLAANSVTAAAIANGAIDAATFAAGAINAAAIATGAIDADALATDAVTEMQAGLATATSVDNLPTNAELAAALATADDATLAAIAGLNNLSEANVSDAVQLAMDGYDVPTFTEMMAGFAAADDATLAAIAALNNVSAAQVQTAATAALNAYDPPTLAESAAMHDSLAGLIAALPTADVNATTLLGTVIGPVGAGTLDERTVRSALRFLRNRWVILAGVLTVYREDDTTVAFTAAVTETPGNPVSQVNPT